MTKQILALAAILFAVLSSAAHAISPAAPVCRNTQASFAYDGPALPIATTNIPVTSQIFVSGLPDFLWDIDARTFIAHSANSHLELTIASPTGTVVTLTTNNGGSNGNAFNGTLWDDQANPQGQVPYMHNNGLVTDALYVNNVVQETLVPEEPLGAFYGEDPNGLWTLSVNDNTAGDKGSVEKWSLQITALAAAPQETLLAVGNDTQVVIPTGPAVVTSTINIPDTSPASICGLEVRTKITHAFAADLDITLQSPSGRVVTLSTDNGTGFDNVFADTVWGNAVNLGGQLPYRNNQGLVTDTLYANLVNNSLLSPEESLQAFAGERAAGNWILTLSDDLASEGGSLDSWTLNLSRCLEANTDGDSAADSCDECVSDPGKTTPGVCGCGVADVDTDKDGLMDCQEACATDAGKVDPGQCGCGIADSDTNANGIVDCLTVPELKFQLEHAEELLSKIDETADGQLPKTANTAKRELQVLLKEVELFVANNSVAISLDGKRPLGSLSKHAQLSVSKALRSSSVADKQAAKKALQQFKRALS